MEQKKTMTPKLRFPEFEGEWEEKRLGEVGEFTGGGTPSKSRQQYWEGNIPWISSSDISEDSIHQFSISRFITKEALEQSATKLVPANSILLVSRVGVGKLAVSNTEVCTSQDFTSFTPDSDNLIFMAYLLKYESKTLIKICQGMAIKGFTKEDISKLNLFLPSKPEQQKIAATLTSLDDLIAAQAEKVKALQAHKKGLMQQLFPAEGERVPRVRFPEFEGKWELKNGNKVFNQISNKDHNSDLPILAITQEHGAIPRDLIDYKVIVTDKSIESYKVVEPGDFIISLRSFQGGIEYSNYYGICSPAYIILRKKIDIGDHFFKYYFKTDFFIQDLSKNIEGIRDGKMVTFKQFSELLLPLPSLPEQQKIAALLSSLDDLITVHNQKLEVLKAHKKGLMQQMFPASHQEAL